MNFYVLGFFFVCVFPLICERDGKTAAGIFFFSLPKEVCVFSSKTDLILTEQTQ